MYVLVVSPRVAPGLLTAQAWDVLRAASVVVSPEDGLHVEAIRAAGVDVQIGDGQPPADGVWIAPPGDVTWARQLAADLVERDRASVEVVVGSYDLPGARLLDVVAVMDRLRRECAWTQAQTHESLRPYLLEEATEALDALDSGDLDHLAEELGDVLMQVVFHAEIAQGWDVDDVAGTIAAKLVRRNPHVFGDSDASTIEEIDAQWQRIKGEERRALRGEGTATV